MNSLVADTDDRNVSKDVIDSLYDDDSGCSSLDVISKWNSKDLSVTIYLFMYLFNCSYTLTVLSKGKPLNYQFNYTAKSKPIKIDFLLLDYLLDIYRFSSIFHQVLRQELGVQVKNIFMTTS